MHTTARNSILVLRRDDKAISADLEQIIDRVRQKSQLQVFAIELNARLSIHRFQFLDKF